MLSARPDVQITLPLPASLAVVFAKWPKRKIHDRAQGAKGFAVQLQVPKRAADHFVGLAVAQGEDGKQRVIQRPDDDQGTLLDLANRHN